MKTKIISTLIPTILIIGCQEKPEGVTAYQSKQAQFEQSDEKITKFLDQLDDPNTAQDVRIQILCKDYPAEYKTHYMPALMKLSPGEYTEGKLIKDLDIALDYYKKKDNVQC